MTDVKGISVSVCYAMPDQQDVIELIVSPQSTVLDAIKKSGILNDHPQIDLSENKVGVHAKLVELDHVLQSSDRVEIYRSLLVDPLQARRNRAKQQND